MTQKVTNKIDKIEIIKAFAWAHENNYIKIHNIKSRFVIEPSDILFSGMYVCSFQLKMLQAVAVKELMVIGNSQHIQYIV